MGSVLDTAVNADKVMVVPASVRSDWVNVQTQYRRKFWFWVSPWFLLAAGIPLGFFNPLFAVGIALIFAGWLCFSIPYRRKFMTIWKQVSTAYFSHVDSFLQKYKIKLSYGSRDKLEGFIRNGVPGESIVLTDILQSAFQFWVDGQGNIQSVLLRDGLIRRTGSVVLGWNSLPSVITLREVIPAELVEKVVSLESNVNVLSSLNDQLTVEEIHVYERAERELHESVVSLVALLSTDAAQNGHVEDFDQVVDLLLAEVAVPLQRLMKSSEDSLRVQSSFLKERARSDAGKLA